MICDARDLPSEIDADNCVLVVGSGPVGLTIARRLSELGLGVWVIEAGREQPDDVDRDSLEAEFGRQVLRGVALGRTRQLGGGLNLWGGQLARFHATEFDSQDPTDLGWPFDASQISGALEMATRLLGQTAWPQAPPSSIAELSDSLARFGLEPIVTTWLRTPKWTRSVWSGLAEKASPRIVLGLAVDGIRLDQDRRRVCGVTARSADGAKRIIHASTVVVAGGTIESVRLLLQPGAAGHPQPWHSLPWLGRGFCEHLDAPVATIAIKRTQAINELFDPSLARGVKQTWKLFGQFRLDDGAIVSGAMMLGLPGHVRNALSELRTLVRSLTPRAIRGQTPRLLQAALASAREVGPLAWRYLRHRRIGTALRGRAVIRASIEQLVRRDNRIALAATRDRLGIHRVRIDWRTGIEEGQTFLALAKRTAGWIEAVGAGLATIDPELLRDPDAFARKADDGLHHAGGARIGESPSSGVVSADLLVHGTIGLYVCSACVFPRPGFANPTLMAAALAVRLANHLATKVCRPGR